MPYAIEISFDAETESDILDIWQTAAEFYSSDYLLRSSHRQGTKRPSQIDEHRDFGAHKQI